jgi:hypothetical protein
VKALATAQPGVQDVAQPRGHSQQRVIATHLGVRELRATLLLQPVGLADRRVHVDNQRGSPGSGTHAPGSLEQLAVDGLELAHMSPGEGAQEGAHGGCRRHPMAEHLGGLAGAQHGHVVDPLRPGEQRRHQRRTLQPDISCPGNTTELDVLIEELAHPYPLHQGSREQGPRVDHQMLLVEADADGIERVGCFHLTGASCCDVGCVEKPIVAVGLRHLSLCQLLLLFGAFGLRVFGWCQEVCGPASPELEPQIEASCLAPETLEISPFHLCPSSEAHGCNLALRDHTQPIYKSKEVGVDLRPVNGVSNITCILMLTGEEAIMVNEANNSVGWVLMSVAQINWPLRRRPSSSDGVHPPRARPSREVPGRAR